MSDGYRGKHSRRMTDKEELFYLLGAAGIIAVLLYVVAAAL